MAEPNRVTDVMLAPDSNSRRFHVGDAPQWDPFAGGEAPTEHETTALAAHRATIRVPVSKPRFGTDEDGTPIEAPAEGLAYNADTGGLEVPAQPMKAEEAQASTSTRTSTRTSSS